MDTGMYIRGVVNMASYNLIPSFMETYCMDNIKEIKEYFMITKNKEIKLNKMNTTFDKLFKVILNISKEEMDTFTYLITKTVGKCINIYKPDEKTFKLIEDNHNYPFFFLEDIYFIEFEKNTIKFYDR